MTGRTHDLAAFTILSYLAATQPLPMMTLGTAVFALFANLVGGIAPDIDEPTAPLWRNLPIGGFFGRIVHQMLGGHRFISHSLLGVGIFGIGWYALLEFIHPSMPSLNIGIVWWAFMVGLVSHLVMDALTKHGIPLFLPLPIKVAFPPIEALRVTTGSWFESLVVFPGLLLLNVWIYTTYYHQLLELLTHHLS